MRYHYSVQIDFGETSSPQYVRYGVDAGSVHRAATLGEKLARREYRRRHQQRGRWASRLPRIVEVSERSSVDAHD